MFMSKHLHIYNYATLYCLFFGSVPQNQQNIEKKRMTGRSELLLAFQKEASTLLASSLTSIISTSTSILI